MLFGSILIDVRSHLGNKHGPTSNKNLDCVQCEQRPKGPSRATWPAVEVTKTSRRALLSAQSRQDKTRKAVLWSNHMDENNMDISPPPRLGALFGTITLALIPKRVCQGRREGVHSLSLEKKEKKYFQVWRCNKKWIANAMLVPPWFHLACQTSSKSRLQHV